MDSLQRRRERVRRRPRRLQKIEADFASLEIHIGVADGRREVDFGRGERVGGRDEDVEAPETGFVSGAGKAFHHSFPVQYLGF